MESTTIGFEGKSGHARAQERGTGLVYSLPLEEAKMGVLKRARVRKEGKEKKNAEGKAASGKG